MFKIQNFQNDPINSDIAAINIVNVNSPYVLYNLYNFDYLNLIAKI